MIDFDLLQNIPTELKTIPQWVVWRYELLEGATKPTKRPYCAKHGFPADIRLAKDYATFNECIGLLYNGGYDGLGFCFTENDPYSFIDLDDVEGNADLLAEHVEIYSVFASYSELSPSGKGLHIIVKGNVPEGRKSPEKKIEIYSKDRYATFTGNVHGAVREIHERQTLLNLLWAKLTDKKRQQLAQIESLPAIHSDDEVIEKAYNAKNGDVFYKLFKGEWQDNYTSQSDADQALFNILAFYTQNHEQIARIFQRSGLGQRQKAYRADYLERSIALAFDRQLPSMDFSALKQRFDDMLKHSVEATKENAESTEAIYSFPPGLMGEIAQFIFEAAPRQVKEIALAGSIAFLAGITGKAFNVSNTGLNNYVFFLGNTGVGKDAIANGFDALFSAIKFSFPQVSEFYGPSEIASPQALIRYLVENPCFVSVWGEAGKALEEMSKPRAPAHLTGLLRIFLDLYTKSGEGRVFRPRIYSEKEKNTAEITSPAFSFIGESNPASFYRALNERMIEDGLLTRFTIIHYDGKRPHANDNARFVKPSSELITKLAALASHCLQLNATKKVSNVQFTNEASGIFKQFDLYCDDKINTSDAEVYRHLWNRAHLKSMKLAALVAIGINPYNPIICEHSAKWAINIVKYDVDIILSKFDKGEVGENNQETLQAKQIKNTIKHYLKTPFKELTKSQQGRTSEALHSVGLITLSYISAKVLNMADFRNDRLGATAALKRTIQIMLENGDLRELTFKEKEPYGMQTARIFAVFNPNSFY